MRFFGRKKEPKVPAKWTLPPEGEEVTNTDWKEHLQGQELAPREFEILELYAKGNTDNEIAEALYLSPHTIKSHGKTILRKLGAKNRTQAVSLAYQTGLLSITSQGRSSAPSSVSPTTSEKERRG